ncbi:MAG: YceI family protein [Rhodobacteraceae bacterium]|nr:YceI family protein [Paracoccaceae bacterium]
MFGFSLPKMIPYFLSAAAVGFTLAAVPSPGLAGPNKWRLDPDQSILLFRYVEDGVTEEGRFGKFDAEGVFDPEAPSDARFTIQIDVDSIKLPDVVRESVVKGVGWFVVEDHPTASYELTALTPIADGRYEATGTLTIKDISHPITTEADVEISETQARVKGELVFPRPDYRLGGGPEEVFFDIGDDVTVAFELVASGS